MPSPERVPSSAVPTSHRHLRRLGEVWIDAPVYFVTTSTHARAPLLANDQAHAVLVAEWSAWRERHGWQVGRYVVMPDHVHFFACALPTTRKSLSQVMQAWKQWTAKRILADPRPPTAEAAPVAGVATVAGVADPGPTSVTPARLWQPEFFDHVLRSSESRSEKWAYVRENPVRAGLVPTAAAWPYAGAIDFD